MLTNTENTTVTLSNDFIQQPQAPFSTVETKLFHAVLLQIHQRDTAFKDSYSILITDIIERKGRNYALLAEAIISLKNRIWFGEHLFLALHHIKNEGVIEFVLNPNLTEHLLCKNGWFASIDVADLYQRGLTHATAWRLLWLLRSWYRPLMKVKEKKLTIAELSNYFFGGDKAFDTFGSLKQHFQYAEKALVAAGIEIALDSKKRGLVGKGLKFIIPDLKLKEKKKPGAKSALEATVETVSTTVMQVIADVKKVAVVAPIAVAMAATPGMAEAAPVAVVEPAPTLPAAGNIGGLVNQFIAKASVALPENTLAVPSLPAKTTTTPRQRNQDIYYALANKWKLSNWQIGLIRVYVDGNEKRCNEVHSVIYNLTYCKGGTSTMKNIGAVTWAEMKKAIPTLT